MGKIVWVFGPTAVGKDTLVTALASQADHPLREDLGLTDEVVVNQDALRLRHEERVDLAAKVAARARRGSTLLLKGQGADLKYQNPQKVKATLPDHEHRLVFVDADPSTIRERRHKRGDPADPWDDERDRRVNLEHADRLALAMGTEFIWIDNRGEVPKKVSKSELHK